MYLSTNYANDTIIVYALSANPNPSLNVTVWDSAALIWNQRFNYTWSNLGTRFAEVFEFWAISPTILTNDEINVSQSITDHLQIGVVTISGADTSDPFDEGTNGNNPMSNTGDTTTASVQMDNSSVANDIILGFLAVQDHPSLTPESGFTQLYYDNGAGQCVCQAVENETISTLQTTPTITYQLGYAKNWTMFADALTIYNSDPTRVYQHVILVPMENNNESTILTLSAYKSYDSFLRKLATGKYDSSTVFSGAVTNYYGVEYPSTPNYVAYVTGNPKLIADTTPTTGYNSCKGSTADSGGNSATITGTTVFCKDPDPTNNPSTSAWDSSTWGFTNKEDASTTYNNIFSEITSPLKYGVLAQGEGSSTCALTDTTPRSNTTYVVHHTALPYVISGTSYCDGNTAVDVGFSVTSEFVNTGFTSGNLYNDVVNNKLPNFTIIVPDECNIMHTCFNGGGGALTGSAADHATLQAGDNFSEGLMNLLQSNTDLWKNTVVFFVWDTGDCAPSAPASCTDFQGFGSSLATGKAEGGHVALIYASGRESSSSSVSGLKSTRIGEHALSSKATHYNLAITMELLLGLHSTSSESNFEAQLFYT